MPLVFGPLALATFTVDGPLYIFLGLGMLVSGVLLRTRTPLWVGFLGGVLVFTALTANTLWQLPR